MISELYAIFAEETAGIDLACRAGCATCCTRNVTLTTAEGRLILGFLRAAAMVLPELPRDPVPLRSGLTTNGLARLCLEGRAADPEEESPWVFEPCFFLRDGLCAIYPVRPFACRSFCSTIPCADTGTAEAPEWLLTLAVVTNQILEELDREGRWGNLADVLAFLAMSDAEGVSRDDENRLLGNQPIPGLLILPEERPRLDRFLAKVRARLGCNVSAC